MHKCVFCLLLFYLCSIFGSYLFCQRNGKDIKVTRSNFIQNLETKLSYYPDKSYDILIRHKANNEHINYVKKTDYYEISEEILKSIIDTKPVFFTQAITIKNKKIKLAFEQVHIHTSDFHVATSEGKKLNPDTKQSIFYRGYIIGDDNSWATLSICYGKLQYLIASDEGNFEIYQIKKGKYIGSLSKNDNKTHSCLTTPDISHTDHILPNHHNSGTRTGNCLQVYMEVDRYTYLQFGDTIAITSWVNTLFLNVSTIYAMHDVPLVLSQIYIRNTLPDPYASLTDIGSVRNQFVNTLQNNYTGRIAHLLTTRPLGGGISNGIGGFCNSYPSYPGPQCVSSSLSASNTINQNYSYNAYVVAHEIGHVMGLRHTQACVWNNTLIQIDDCGNVHAANNGLTPEGSSCFNASNPVYPAGGGTIMSNCNQIPGVGIKLNQGFGVVPGQLLYDKFVYASCNTGTACNSIAPINNLCGDAINLPVTTTCTNFTFTNQNATATNGPPSFSCGNAGAVIKDVWFKVSIPSSGSVTIETSQPSGGLTDVIIQAYAGNCNGLSIISCDDNSGAGNHALLTLTGRTPGELVYIRLVDSQSNEEGTFNICAYHDSVTCHPDFSSLVALYNATGGPSWINKSGWQNGAAGTNCNVCTWYGISCNEIGRVNVINLPSNNLSGSIPASLSNITYLNALKLYNNTLSGNIPAFFNTFGFLNTLDLGKNNFTGSIPSSLGSVATLKNIYLDFNQLNGSLPVSLANINLSLLYVNNNNLSGCFPSGYHIFCQKSTNFSGNANLAGGIAFATYCSTGIGGDEDNDGYCKGLTDCNDNDNTIFPGNPELCDRKDNNCNGLVDDIANPQTNYWTGSSGSWHNASNWSLGVVPDRCHNVMISGANEIVITIEPKERAEARSVTIGTSNNLEIEEAAILSIDYGLNLVNAGNITNNGNINIHNILDNALFGLSNSGIIHNNSLGVISIMNSGIRSFSNNSTGILTNNGTLTIDSNVINGSSTGFYNLGTTTNTGGVTVKNITGHHILITPGSNFTNLTTGILSIE